MVRSSKQVRTVNTEPLCTHSFRTFSSEEEYQLVRKTWNRLIDCGFYHDSIDGREASSMMEDQPIGTFLIRDSQDRKHFFTLSIKTEYGTKHVRIQCKDGSFYLQTAPGNKEVVPRFRCVLSLVFYYVNSQRDLGKEKYFIYSGQGKIPLEMRRPFLHTTFTLQQLCRNTVKENKDRKVFVGINNLPKPILEFLSLYESPF